MTGILKQLSASCIANVATDNYEAEAAKILHLNDQIDRATQALNIVSGYDRKLADGWLPTTQFDRSNYQQSMESASALTYDFMQLDVGYSTEASEKSPGMLKRIWEWIKAAVSNLMKMIRKFMGLQKTKLIRVEADLKKMLEAIGRIAKDKAEPFSDSRRPNDPYVINASGAFVGTGNIRSGLDACAKATNTIVSNIEKLVNFDATSVTPVKNKVETGGMIRSKLGLEYKFNLIGEMKLDIGIATVNVEGRSGMKHHTYTGAVLAASAMKEACQTSLKAIDELSSGEAAAVKSLNKFDQRIEAIRKKNYEALGNRHYDAMKQKMEANRRGPQVDYDKLEQDANVFNALTTMIDSHCRAISQTYFAGLTYLGSIKHFVRANLEQYRELAE